MNMEKYACAYFISPIKDTCHMARECDKIAYGIQIPIENVRLYYHWCPKSSKLTTEDIDYFSEAVIQSFYDQASSDETCLNNLKLAEEGKSPDTFIIYLMVDFSLSAKISDRIVKDFTDKYEKGNISILPILFSSDYRPLP